MYYSLWIIICHYIFDNKNLKSIDFTELISHSHFSIRKYFYIFINKKNNKISFHNIYLASTDTRLPERICVKTTFIARKANGFPVGLAPYKVSPTKGCPIWLKATRI